MFKYHFKAALRNLKRNGLFSWLNIAGLSVGLAVTILLFLFVLNELDFDTMYSNRQHIFRVLMDTKINDGKEEKWCNVPNAVAPTFTADIPEIKYAARMLKNGFGKNAFIKYGNNNFIEKNLYWCDADLLKIFDVPFISGNSKDALNRPNTGIISATTAKKIFGSENPIGKTITADNTTLLEITGVYKDFAANSTLDCNMIGSFGSTVFSKNNSWSNASFETYCLLDKNADTALLNKKMQVVIDKNVPKEKQWFSLLLQPLKDVHLYSATYTNTYATLNGDINEVKNLFLLALLILVIACINYMNLATARSQQKAKDVGINKTLGASFKNLLLRFYTETGLITFIALLIGLVLAVAAIPLFNLIAGKNLTSTVIFNSKIIPGLALLWLLITIVAGSYPALFLARLQPIQIIQHKVHSKNSARIIRKSLVIVQFTASVILIAAILIVFLQLQFIRDKKMGYNPQNVVAINTIAAQTKDQINACINELKEQSNVVSVCSAQGFPGMKVSGRTLLKSADDKEGISIQTNRVTNGFADVLQLKLIAGKLLPDVKPEKDTIVDVVLNKEAIEYLGYTPEEAIGKKVSTQLGENAYIVGVVENFNFESLHKPIGAYAFHNAKGENRDYLLIRFRTGNQPNTMQQFEASFKRTIPNAAFDYIFLDQYLQTLYAGEQRMANITLTFSLLAIFIACLGLFGLAAYTAEQRTKEIGVRKVLGASTKHIAALLSKDFLQLVLFAVLIATPVSWWAANKWLQGFAYRIDIGWWIFAGAGLVAVTIALVTVSSQAIKAALANPVKSLRTE